MLTWVRIAARLSRTIEGMPGSCSPTLQVSTGASARHKRVMPSVPEYFEMAAATTMAPSTELFVSHP
jgi:hypothetical protein